MKEESHNASTETLPFVFLSLLYLSFVVQIET